MNQRTRHLGGDRESISYWATGIAAVLFLCALVFAASAFYLVQQSLLQQSAYGNAMLAQRDNMLMLVNEETGVRGYVATRDPQFLDIYYRSHEQLARAHSILQRYRDLPAVAEDMDETARAQDAITVYFGVTIANVRAHRIQPRAQLERGKVLFDRFRSTAADWGGDVSRAWVAARARSVRYARYGLTGTVAACGLLALWWIAFVMAVRQTNVYRRSALRDSLTGALNRRGALAAIERNIAKAGAEFGVIFIDLDGFKKINDMYGHAAGDAILSAVATRLKSELRAGDDVCRLGGDEFVCVVASPAGAEHVRTIARRLRKSVARMYSFGGEDYIIGCSVGVCMYPDHGESADMLLSAADRAMYVAKAGGGGVREAAWATA